MRLLVIEDNRNLIANLFDYFEARGHVLDVAPDGVTGLHLAATQPYDAIRATLTPIQADTAVSTAPQVTSVTTIRQFQPFSTAHEVNS